MTKSPSRYATILMLVVLHSTKTQGKNLLRGEASNLSTNHALDVQTFRKDIRNDVSIVPSALACGKPVSDSELAATKEMLVPLWASLPKNSFGNVGRQALRYMAHRHFSRRFNIWVRGFEPTRAMNDSAMDAAETLTPELPLYVEAVLKSKHNLSHGFSLEDAVNMVIILQQIMWDSTSAMLEHVYKDFGRTTQQSLSHKEVLELVHSYFFHWLIGEDIHAGQNVVMLHNLSHIEMVAHPTNAELLDFVNFVYGEICAMHWRRTQVQLPGQSRSLWNNQYSFNDVQRIATGMAASFGSYWASECRDMKIVLAEMDPRGMGRVPIAKFYAATVQGKHRFAESAEYLRELGILDETSIIFGTQVIISNYLQAASNCLVSTSHYRICCPNECENILAEIEFALGSSAASPSAISEVVMNLTKYRDEDDDDSHMLLASGRQLIQQLEDIASIHAGQVKVHGRLFSQWLHFAFPRECPFPHRIGTVSHATPREYGNVSFESWASMQQHAGDPLEVFASESLFKMETDDLEWMSQWSSEEEVIFEMAHDLLWTQAMPKRERVLLSGILLALLGGLANIASHYAILYFRAATKWDQHAHYV